MRALGQCGKLDLRGHVGVKKSVEATEPLKKIQLLLLTNAYPVGDTGIAARLPRLAFNHGCSPYNTGVHTSPSSGEPCVFPSVKQ